MSLVLWDSPLNDVSCSRVGSQIDPPTVTRSEGICSSIGSSASIHVLQMDQYQCLPFSYSFIKNDRL